MTTFFTADAHFDHARIIHLSRRPFEGIAETRAEAAARLLALLEDRKGRR